MSINDNYVLYDTDLYNIKTISWSDGGFTIFIDSVKDESFSVGIFNKEDWKHFNLIKPYKKVSSIFKKVYKDKYKEYENKWVNLYLHDWVLALQVFEALQKEVKKM